MKKFHVYEVYLDDNHDVIKVTIPAESKVAVKKYVEGNGEIVAIKDSDLQDIDLSCLTDTLWRNGWGHKEISVITRTLQAVGLDR